MEIIEKSQTIKKHIGTVHISSPLNLLERKLFNVLLINSYTELLKKERFSIDVPVMCRLLGFETNNHEPLKKAIRKLSKTTVEWTIFDKNKKEEEWGVTTFISGGIIKNGRCEYGYSPFLKDKLYNPEIYARISLETQKKFERKYSLILYENCIRFRPKGSFKGGTGFMPIDDFRKLMGVNDISLYSTFKELNRRIIKPAVKEINEFSEIIISPELKKEGRFVSEIRFDVKDNPQLRLNFDEDVDVKTDTPLIQDFKKYGIPEMLTQNWISTYGEDYLKEKLELCEKNLVAGKIKKNVGGYLVKAVQGDYKQVDPKEEKRRLEKQKQELILENRRKKFEQQEAKKKEEQAKINLSKKIDKAVEEYFYGLPKQKQEKIEKELKDAGKLNEFNDKERYFPFYKSTLMVFVRENYFDEEILLNK